MKIRIKNDTGIPNQTHITDEDGNTLDCITNLRLNHDYRGMKAELTFDLVTFDITTKAVVSPKHLKELAEYHGYDLVKKEAIWKKAQ